ncbi:hypothetical protein [Inhella gelatinilytica]|uniref:Peptidase metallopeptidase domain-containing protein n=1 Tax=Inhella gelatinilytica TaxID=2795030 RepID=A0A931IU86_9BURK|nr:hypothetical protein [Inhella gelatinilytica]MBH9552057.1 hypothetical protein [Inhella gelatinilytica]
MQGAVRQALQSFAAVAQLTFTEVDASSDDGGTLRYGQTNQIGATTYAFAAIPLDVAIAGDMWINSGFVFPEGWAAGTQNFLTLLHEIGHTLGLKHPHDGLLAGLEGWPATPVILEKVGDDTLVNFSVQDMVMAYNDVPNADAPKVDFAPTTPMRYDIAALQYLYGPNLAFNAGDTVYTFDGALPYNQTIWDGGGIDTLVAVGERSVRIDLTPGSWSQLGLPLTYSARDEKLVVTGPLAQYTRLETVLIYDTVIIENAIGSSGNDWLQGNDAANRLDGGLGNDHLLGAGGSDIFIWSGGNDTLDGGAGFDVVWIGDSTAGQIDLKGGIGTLGSAILSLVGIEAVRCSTGDDTCSGLDGADNLPGEVFKGAGGNDTISGGSGIDRAEFSGNFSDYQITRKPGSMEITVTHKNGGADGIDSLNSIELLVFQDRVIGFGQRAEEVARVAFVLWNPAIYNVPELFAAGLSFYTNEYAYTLNDLCKVALIFRPEKTAQELVATLLANTPGTSKTAAQLYAIMDANGGQSSQTGWAAAIEAMALDAATSAQLDLMGVAQNGLAATYNWGTQPCFWPLVGG